MRRWVQKNFRAIATLIVGAAIGAFFTYSFGVGQPTVACHDHRATTADTITLTWRNGWSETLNKSEFDQLVNDSGSLMGAGFVDPSIPGMDQNPTLRVNPGIQLYNETLCDVNFSAQGAPHWGMYVSGGKKY